MTPGRSYFLVDGDEPIEFFLDSVYLLMGHYLVPITEVPCGNILGIGSLQDLVFKTATISSVEDCPNFAPMQLQATPIVKVSIESQNIFDM
jgi:ribosome assembly protein 1